MQFTLVARTVLRRAFDCAVALVALALGFPFVALAAVAVKLSSRGPVIYRASRAGVGGIPFTMFKLRTMHVGSDAAGPITASGDPRTFAAGRAIRRFKLDELPQLLNVLLGQMALVGPRPEDADIVVDHYTPLMWETLSVPPGMTSAGSLHYYLDEDQLPTEPAEAEALYLEKLLPAKIAVDLQYVRRPRFAYELQILLRTALAVVGADRVFESVRLREASEAQRILAEAGVR